MNKKKASLVSDIPVEFIKDKVDIFVEFICENINKAFKSSLFSACLKSEDVTPLLKKGKNDLKENYRPVSIL